jgi:serine/threonine protein kinase
VALAGHSCMYRSYSHIGTLLIMTGFVGMRIGGPSGDRYELTRPLGSGAFGDAWEARDHDEDSTVVVKLLSPGTNPDDVLREASLHRRLSAHPRVVSMRNVEIGANPSSFVVSELVPGGSLDGVLASRRPTVVESQRWLRDVLEGLAHAHGMSVLHRDVKPSNVLLGADGHAMLTDFGVADDSVRRAVTEPGMYHLTMPPEFGHVPTSRQTDLWLAGMLGYQLLTGRRPSLTEAHAGSVVLAHRLSPDVPLALARAVHSGLAVDPSDRPDRAERMLEEIGAPEIRAGWHDVDTTGDPGLVRAWQADEAGGEFTVEIRRRARGGYRVSARAKPGSRLRARRQIDAPTLASASQAARSWLLRVVGGKPL